MTAFIWDEQGICTNPEELFCFEQGDLKARMAYAPNPKIPGTFCFGYSWSIESFSTGGSEQVSLVNVRRGPSLKESLVRSAGLLHGKICLVVAEYSRDGLNKNQKKSIEHVNAFAHKIEELKTMDFMTAMDRAEKANMPPRFKPGQTVRIISQDLVGLIDTMQYDAEPGAYYVHTDSRGSIYAIEDDIEEWVDSTDVKIKKGDLVSVAGFKPVERDDPGTVISLIDTKKGTQADVKFNDGLVVCRLLEDLVPYAGAIIDIGFKVGDRVIVPTGVHEGKIGTLRERFFERKSSLDDRQVPMWRLDVGDDLTAHLSESALAEAVTVSQENATLQGTEGNTEPFESESESLLEIKCRPDIFWNDVVRIVTDDRKKYRGRLGRVEEVKSDGTIDVRFEKRNSERINYLENFDIPNVERVRLLKNGDRVLYVNSIGTVKADQGLNDTVISVAFGSTDNDGNEVLDTLDIEALSWTPDIILTEQDESTEETELQEELDDDDLEEEEEQATELPTDHTEI